MDVVVLLARLDTDITFSEEPSSTSWHAMPVTQANPEARMKCPAAAARLSQLQHGAPTRLSDLLEGCDVSQDA